MPFNWRPMEAHPEHLAPCLVTIEFYNIVHKGQRLPNRREVWGAVYTDGRGFLLTSGAIRTVSQGLRTAEEMDIPARLVAWCRKPDPYDGTYEEDLLA